MTDDALLDAAKGYARERLSEGRYAHALRVADTAERLAKLYGLDPKKARLSALLHDAAREMDKDELLWVAKEEGLPISDFERERPVLLHGPVAAELACKELGVKDAEVREAICHHTTGAPGIGPLALTLYVADKIEPGRKESGVEGLRKVALKSLRRAAMAALEGSISHNERCGRPTHPKSLKTLEWLKSDEGERLGEPKV
ncbi:MAG: bis(5'-nucleosyl)-tetraphosphatase (symmetrical) YqeK [Actinomycetota bacterium]|nr:bis(5'-nucleosyl)-tetraphosphatase (symmetrical) YqeK [Actinomycetota bacterium]